MLQCILSSEQAKGYNTWVVINTQVCFLEGLFLKCKRKCGGLVQCFIIDLQSIIHCIIFHCKASCWLDFTFKILYTQYIQLFYAQYYYFFIHLCSYFIHTLCVEENKTGFWRHSVETFRHSVSCCCFFPFFLSSEINLCLCLSSCSSTSFSLVLAVRPGAIRDHISSGACSVQPHIQRGSSHLLDLQCQFKSN